MLCKISLDFNGSYDYSNAPLGMNYTEKWKCETVSTPTHMEPIRGDVVGRCDTQTLDHGNYIVWVGSYSVLIDGDTRQMAFNIGRDCIVEFMDVNAKGLFFHKRWGLD